MEDFKQKTLTKFIGRIRYEINNQLNHYTEVTITNQPITAGDGEKQKIDDSLNVNASVHPVRNWGNELIYYW